MEFDINRGIKKNDNPQLTDLVEDFRNHWRRAQAILHTIGVVQFKGDNRLTGEQ